MCDVSSWEDALQGLELAHHLIDALVDRMASDVVLLDLSARSAFTDYFVIATIDNERQMRAVVDAVEAAAREAGEAARSEGTTTGGWVLIEASNVVVHLFSLERRLYYDLEGLWSQAQELVHIQ